MLQWPSQLRQTVLSIVTDQSACGALWHCSSGSTVLVHNEIFGNLFDAGPPLQGQPLAGGLSEWCSEIPEVLQQQHGDGLLKLLPSLRAIYQRHSFVQERVFSWKFVPIFGDDGSVVGSLVSVTEDSIIPDDIGDTNGLRSPSEAVSPNIDYMTSLNAVSMLQPDRRFSGTSCDCGRLWHKATELEQSEQRYRKFADLAPVGIALLDQDLMIEFANKAYFEITGQPVPSRSLLSCIRLDDVPSVDAHLQRARTGSGPVTFECRLEKKATRPAVSPGSGVPDQVPAWILVTAYTEMDPTPHTICWTIDITAHKVAEQVLRQQMDEAVEMRRQQEHFIDMISHEVRNPLSAVVHCTQEIIESCESSRGAISNDILESAKTVEYCAQHIRDILGDVLTLSKLDSKMVEVVPVPVQPIDIVQNAVKIFSGEMKAAKIELHIMEDSSVHALGADGLLLDPSRMLQILINMLTNAVKAVQQHARRKITVSLKAFPSEPSATPEEDFEYVSPPRLRKSVDFGKALNAAQCIYLVIAVKDTGPGLPSGERAALLDRFNQVRPKTETRYGGTGLGLFICRTLAELQGGRLGIPCERSEGSTFAFFVETRRSMTHARTPDIRTPEIPQRMRHSSPSVLRSPTKAGAEKHHQGHDVTQLRKEDAATVRVLVVEDNLVNQKVLAKQLRKRNYEVSIAAHGKEALEVLLPASDDGQEISASFDVVLMDIEMPVMDGLTCVKHIRLHEATRGSLKKVPIIAVTANVREEHTQAAMDVGMDAITTKPYRIEELVHQMEQLLSG